MSLVEILSLVATIYVALLFLVAFWADRRRQMGRSVTRNASVYVLSLGVWHTSWTFYGNVGRAATVGIDFIAIYLGSTLVLFSGWFLLRRIVRISKEQNLVSIADFIASRYGNSVGLGALVAFLAVVGTVPYLALQLKGISQSFAVFFPPAGGSGPGTAHPVVDVALGTALLLALFAVLFGARRLDPSARHEGLVAAVALESLFKLAAMLAVGLFFTYGLFSGFDDLFSRFLSRFPDRKHLLLLGDQHLPYVSWFSLGLVCCLAFLCLPHLFHLMVVENHDEEHILSAMWRFPLYMFMIELFIIPIALGGLLIFNGETSGAEYFSLRVPLQTGHSALAILVFIGGFSGSAGMVMVASVALATLILNNLIVPGLLQFGVGKKGDLSKTLLTIKRIAVIAVIFVSYLFYRLIGEAHTLVGIGLISFVAAAQFAPALLGGLFWKRATLKGAMGGLICGGLLWIFTLVLPALAHAGWVGEDLLLRGLFGWRWLRPEALFGLEALPALPHALFWTLLANVGVFLLLSNLTVPTTEEGEQAEKFVDVFRSRAEPEVPKRFSRAPTVQEFADLMAKFIGEERAYAAVTGYLEDKEIDYRGSLAETELTQMKHFAERTLAGSVGAAPARTIIDSYFEAQGSTIEDVFDIFGSVTISRKAGREQLGVLYEATRTVASGADLDNILNDILNLLRQQFRFDFIVVRLLDRHRARLVVRRQSGMSREHLDTSDRELDMDSYAGATFLTNQTMVVNDTDYLDQSKRVATIRRECIKSFIHAPITVGGEPIGVFSIFSKTSKGLFTDEFADFFTNLAAQVGVACRNAEQAQELIAARQRQRELEIARDIQSGLLPLSAPEVPGLALAGKCEQAKEVGGDYYDFLLHDSGCLDVLIADVSGHDVGAAMLMAEARTFVHARARGFSDPARGLASLNAFLYDDLSRAELFITMFYLRCDVRNRRLSFASAGHNPPLLWRARDGRCERLDAEGLILGVRRQVHFEEKVIDLHPMDTALLYTDGLTEAENPQGEFFGEGRLEALLSEHHALSPEQLLAALLSEVKLFVGGGTLHDDVTLAVVQAAFSEKNQGLE